MRDPEDPRLIPAIDRPPVPPPSLVARMGRIGLVLITAVAVLIVLPVLVLAGGYLLGDVLNPPCTDEDRAVWSSINHYRDVEPEGVPGVSGCVANFEAEESPDRIISHYRSALRADGWLIDEEGYSTGTLPPEPLGDASGAPAQMPGVYHMIGATRDDYAASVSWEQTWVNSSQPDTEARWEVVTRVMVSVYPID